MRDPAANDLPVTKEEDEAFHRINLTTTSAAATVVSAELTVSGGFAPKADLTVTSATYGQVKGVIDKIDTLAVAIDTKLPEFDTSLREWMGDTIRAHMTGGEIKPFPKAVLDVGIRTSRFTLDGLYEHCKTGDNELDEYIINAITGFFTDMSKPEPTNILRSLAMMVKFSTYMRYIAKHGIDLTDYTRHVLQRCGNGDVGDLTTYLDPLVAAWQKKEAA